MGIVSAKDRHLGGGSTSIENFIQTDASINPGNSGGALINAHGELIGMNTMILTGGNSFGGEGGSVGIGFAVPSNMAKQVMDQIEKTGKVSRGYLGATLQTVDSENAPLLGLKEPHGAIVADVSPNGPGQKAGLKSGDVITAIDGKKVDGKEDLTLDVIGHTPGSTVSLDVMRNGQPMKLTATLGTRPTGTDWDQPKNGNKDNGDDQDNNSSGNVSLRGITVETLTPEIAQQVGVPSTTRGVVVDDVDASSAAAEVVGKGTVIVGVNRQPVNNAQDFKRLMGQAAGKAVLLTVNSNGSNLFLVVQP
jgi:serine protease Do